MDFFGNGEESGVVGFVVSDKGAVGLDDDVVGLAIGDYGALLAEGVELLLGRLRSVRAYKGLLILYGRRGPWEGACKYGGHTSI